jgi:hypothetical protein
MKRTTFLLIALALLAATLPAADVTGKWKGAMQTGGRELTFDLKADGAKLTGTVTGLIDKPVEIKDGKIQGDAVEFWVMSEYQGAPVKLVYKGKAGASEILFNMGTEDGSWGTEIAAKKI